MAVVVNLCSASAPTEECHSFLVSGLKYNILQQGKKSTFVGQQKIELCRRGKRKEIEN